MKKIIIGAVLSTGGILALVWGLHLMNQVSAQREAEREKASLQAKNREDSSKRAIALENMKGYLGPVSDRFRPGACLGPELDYTHTHLSTDPYISCNAIESETKAQVALLCSYHLGDETKCIPTENEIIEKTRQRTIALGNLTGYLGVVPEIQPLNCSGIDSETEGLVPCNAMDVKHDRLVEFICDSQTLRSDSCRKQPENSNQGV